MLTLLLGKINEHSGSTMSLQQEGGSVFIVVLTFSSQANSKRNKHFQANFSSSRMRESKTSDSGIFYIIYEHRRNSWAEICPLLLKIGLN
jgi:hypothetical protein